MLRTGTGWGYQLDYDKEIAVDLREIEQTERHIPLAAALTEPERDRGPWHVCLESFLVADLATRAPLLQITAAELNDLAEFLEGGIPGIELPPKAPPGAYARGRATWERTHAAFGDHVLRDPQILLKKLRTRLARHRRNQKRFG